MYTQPIEHPRIPELELLSMCFLSSTITPSPVLALLHIDFKLRYRILAREVDLANQELSIEPSQILPPAFVQDRASLLIPVPGSSDLLGGILVLGGGIVQFFECTSPSTRKHRKKDRQSLENKRKRTRGSTEDESIAIRANLPFHDIVAYVPVCHYYHNLTLCLLFSDVGTRLSMTMATEY
jgi:Mono-functional DNA-alkylating methyl methanesulfonate N-term